MEEHEHRWRLAVKYLGINTAALFFAAAALLLAGPLAAIGTFMVAVTVLLAVFYMKKTADAE